MAFVGFGTCLFQKISSVFVLVAEVRSLTGPGITRETVDVTHLKSPDGFREFLPALKEGSDVTFDLNFDPGSASHKALLALKDTTIPTDFKVIWSDDDLTEWEFSATLASFEPTAEVDGPLSAAVTLKVAGAITIPL